ncbi:MAG TPA: CAP domain-containing protein [bacterium]|nr:CAP domain-containing protein [bacterium]
MKKSYRKIRSTTLAIVLLSLFVSFSFGTRAFASEITPENVVLLINKERTYHGLKPLVTDDSLNRASYLKSRDMIRRNYFDHYGFGLTPWVFIRNSGYDYIAAGENLAMDFDTAEGMVAAWMDSPLHRSNILSSEYEDIGTGVVRGAHDSSVKGETTMVTNMFGKKKSPLVTQVKKAVDGLLTFFGF